MNKEKFKNIDYILIIIVLCLFIIGMVAIISATRVSDYGLTREVKVQSFAFIIGIIAIVFVMLIDYHFLGKLYWFIYGFSILFLLLVYLPDLGFVKGVTRGNAQSWINLFGKIDVQTSEIAKIGFIISLAKFLDIHKEDINRPITLLKVIAFISPFLILIYKQPDFGSMLVFLSITGGMLLVAKLDFKYIGIALGLVVIALKNADKFLSKTQMNRLFAFLEPDNLKIPANYHVNASKTTIGAGMLKGRGLFEGVYHKGDWLPVQETDFIFAVFVEELGFIGGIILIGLFLLFLLDLMKIAYKAKEEFGSYIVVGIVFMFLFQIFENIAMTMGIMPVTGITLPFISYGGSSMITNMIMVGLALNVYMRRRKTTMFSDK